MAAPTITQVARVVLRDWGILYLNPASPASQTNPIRAIDLEDAALVLSAAFQTIARKSGIEGKTQPGGAVLRAPTPVTLTATDGSATISALTTYAAWQLGCTIRIAGDPQDNELLSSTLLARPFVGTGGAGLTATVYADAVTLDDNVGRVLSPMLAGGQWPVREATTRHEFVMAGGYDIATGEEFAGHPFWSLGSKPSGQPAVFFLDNYYDAALGYIVPRIRLSPMPAARQSLGWTSAVNPRRVIATDITTGTPFADTSLVIPCASGWVESIFLPIARQIATGCRQFKNDGIKQEIGRQYAEAIDALESAGLSAAPARTIYI